MVPDGSGTLWHYTGYEFVQRMHIYIKHSYSLLHGEGFCIDDSYDSNAIGIIARAVHQKHKETEKQREPQTDGRKASSIKAPKK